MKDPEIAEAKAGHINLKDNVRNKFTSKKVLTSITIAVCLFGMMFGIGVLASCFGMCSVPVVLLLEPGRVTICV